MKTISVLSLLDDGFRNTMQKVCKLPLDQRHALRILKTAKAVEKEHEEYIRLKEELLQKYCEKDEDDNLVVGDKGGVTILKENLPFFVADHKEITDKDFEVEGFSIKDLANARLSVQDIMSLEPVLID